ncbi:MAG TPA: hypothetical protein VNA12_09805 [Mycobacteriales bacterium]|nr:hypothetical protein [Mycobacteriales bacterium]
MTSRLAVIPLALTAVLVTSACTDRDDATGSGGRSASPTVSVRPTIAAPVADGIVAATFDVTSDVKVDDLIARLNRVPGVLGAGFFANESRIVIRLKPDATKEQIAAAVAAVRKETSLTDVVFEAPEPSPKASPQPSPTPSAPSKPAAKPSSTASAY